MSLHRTRTSKHLKSDIIIVSVIVGILITIIQVLVVVHARTRRRRGPVVVVVPARRRIAFPLFAAMVSRSTLDAAGFTAPRHLAGTSIRHIRAEAPRACRGKRQQHSLQAPFVCSHGRKPHEAPAFGRRNALPLFLPFFVTTSFHRFQSKLSLTTSVIRKSAAP